MKKALKILGNLLVASAMIGWMALFAKLWEGQKMNVALGFISFIGHWTIFYWCYLYFFDEEEYKRIMRK